jgi:CRISPR/Cas system CMR-associated protein Cmr3 (group 5 of RAMP superfamily)
MIEEFKIIQEDPNHPDFINFELLEKLHKNKISLDDVIYKHRFEKEALRLKLCRYQMTKENPQLTMFHSSVILSNKDKMTEKMLETYGFDCPEFEDSKSVMTEISEEIDVETSSQCNIHLKNESPNSGFHNSEEIGVASTTD